MSVREWHGHKPLPMGGNVTDVVGQSNPTGAKRRNRKTRARKTRTKRTGAKNYGGFKVSPHKF